jgi:hypothetical protein
MIEKNSSLNKEDTINSEFTSFLLNKFLTEGMEDTEAIRKTEEILKRLNQTQDLGV